MNKETIYDFIFVYQYHPYYTHALWLKGDVASYRGQCENMNNVSIYQYYYDVGT